MCGLCAVFVRSMCGLCAALVRSMCGVCAVYVRSMCGVCAVFVRCLCGFGAVYVRCLRGVCAILVRLWRGLCAILVRSLCYFGATLVRSLCYFGATLVRSLCYFGAVYVRYFTYTAHTPRKYRKKESAGGLDIRKCMRTPCFDTDVRLWNVLSTIKTPRIFNLYSVSASSPAAKNRLRIFCSLEMKFLARACHYKIPDFCMVRPAPRFSPGTWKIINLRKKFIITINKLTWLSSDLEHGK